MSSSSAIHAQDFVQQNWPALLLAIMQGVLALRRAMKKSDAPAVHSIVDLVTVVSRCRTKLAEEATKQLRERVKQAKIRKQLRDLDIAGD